MTKKVKNLIKGAGSIINISSSTNFHEIPASGTAAKRIEGYWNNVGRHIHVACKKASLDYNIKDAKSK